MTAQVKMPFMVEWTDKKHRNDWRFALHDALIRVESDCEEFNRTGKTTKKITEIWVEWTETHWLQSTFSDPDTCLKKANRYLFRGEVYAEDTSRFGKKYANETFAKAFAMSLIMDHKTTLEMNPNDYEHWDGFDPKNNIHNFPTVAVRMGVYPDIDDERFEWLAEHYFELTEYQRDYMKPKRVVTLNYYFEKGGE